MDEARIALRGSEPIFPVANVVDTVRYYREVLGFQEEWLWGEPPDFGGARWGKIGVMFSLQSDPDVMVGGQRHAFFVQGIDELHRLHIRNGATITSPLEQQPWGLREYVVRDLNGHFLRFGQPAIGRTETAGREPATGVTIVERMLTPAEYLALVDAVGWSRYVQPGRAGAIISAASFGVVAVDKERAVGAGMVISDGVSFAYLKDIMVFPEWQGRGIGTRIVRALMAILRHRSRDRVLVTLFTGQNLAEFYEPFGFAGPERLYGMSTIIERSTVHE